jgi:26S proteasome regulatory subunit N6
MTEAEAMEIDPTPPAAVTKTATPSNVNDEDAENISDLTTIFESITSSTSPSDQIQILTSILTEPSTRYGPKATALKERSIYSLARVYCTSNDYQSIPTLLTGPFCSPFFTNVTKAKCAKVVRAVLEIICTLAPKELDMQEEICESILKWTESEKRTFLKQRVQAKLAMILFLQSKYATSLNLVNSLLAELKKIDDKQLLVETHLVESKIHHALRNLPKSKAALTASRTAANAIYVAPGLQSTIDEMSGVLHCEEGDYNTAHSYFLESFEQLDTLEGNAEKKGETVSSDGEGSSALKCLKYMMLCKILDNLTKALQLSAKGGVGAKSDKTSVDIASIISSKQGVKYAGRDIDAMTAIASAASERSLAKYQSVTSTFSTELQGDLLIKHHLNFLHEQLLESNLIRIIEPYSCVEITHVANLIEMPLATVEKKLSQMILDEKLNGILDQGKGHLIVYEDSEKDLAMEKGLKVIGNMDEVVSSLFVRSRALRTMVG